MIWGTAHFHDDQATNKRRLRRSVPTMTSTCSPPEEPTYEA
jgi:hypothetical protein